MFACALFSICTKFEFSPPVVSSALFSLTSFEDMCISLGAADAGCSAVTLRVCGLGSALLTVSWVTAAGAVWDSENFDSSVFVDEISLGSEKYTIWIVPLYSSLMKHHRFYTIMLIYFSTFATISLSVTEATNDLILFRHVKKKSTKTEKVRYLES